ncbi:MAG: hypothetical protein AAGA68_10540 [Pseudomonadota bacterium]
MRSAIVGLSLLFGACTEPLAAPTLDPDPAIRASATSAEKISNAIGAGLQGDARRAVALLRTVDPIALDGRDQQYRSCMLERFGSARPLASARGNDSAFASRVVEIYQRYWRRSLKAPESRHRHTKELEQALRQHMRLPDGTDSVAIERALRARLEAQGLHALLGQTGVLRELMIWRREERRSETVEMPHGTYSTDVAFLDDFVVTGWGQFATCETRGAGGWVADKTLFAVVPIYEDLEGEEFRVTFLGHETQHFLDLEQFPDMAPWELEYRAKLMELAMAQDTRARVLQKFIEDQGDDPSSHHSYANRKVLRVLMGELSAPSPTSLLSVNGQSLRDAAYRLFKSDTAMRDR